MAQLRQDHAQFSALGAEILVVSPEDQAEVRAYWQRESLPFAGCADPDHEVAKLYGQAVNLLKLGRMPELVVIDRSGRIRYIHHAGSMSDIPPNREILELLASIEVEESHG